MTHLKTGMRAAADRNPNITLVGLPWGFPGWLGFNTSNPYHNVSATADYVAKWVECGRDLHNLNVSVLGLWNEAWQAAGRPRRRPSRPAHSTLAVAPAAASMLAALPTLQKLH